MKKLVLLAITFVITLNLYCQNCNSFHKDIACKVEDLEGFKLFGQSRSATVMPGATNKYQVILFGGYDYKVGICTLKGFTPIHFRIINPADQSILFDNEKDKFIETVGFSNEKTKNVIFELTLSSPKKAPTDVWETRACLGIAIYWHKIPKLGIEN